MFRKPSFFLSILLLSSIFCLTNTFAEENGEPIDIEQIIAEGNFAFPTADGAAYIQGNAEFEKTPEVIIGASDFEKVRDLATDSQDYQLSRQVGMILTLNRARDRVGVCTGFLVGPDLFMTNHHCIHDNRGLLPLGTATAIFMDYYQDEAVDDTLGGRTARASALLHADAAKDYALLRLDRPIGNTYGWLELDTTTVPNSSQSVKLISHNDGRSKEIVRRNSQIFTIPPGHPLFNVPSAIAYLADSEAGSSGSPVFLRDGTGVIAIHHSGWTNGAGVPIHNAGSLMSHIVPEIQQYLPQPPQPDVYMYWVDTSTDTIQRAGLDGSNVRDIVTTGLSTPTSIAVDLEGGKMYWIDSGTDKIQRANLDGSNIEDIVTTGLRTPNDMALDLTDGKVYWIDSGTDKIQRANLDGSNIEDIVTTGLRTPKGIALDLTWSKVYWIDSGTDKIQRANLDGSNIEDIITAGLRTPTDIEIDMEGGKVYWTDSGTDTIQRANLNGSNIEDIVTTGLRTPTSITLDPEAPENASDGKMYWTDSGTDKIQRANLDGSNIEDIVTTGLRTPKGIALGIPQVVPPRPSNAAPTFGNATIASITATVGQAIARRILPEATDADGDTLTYAITPTLPAGLTFNSANRELTGTPTKEMAQTDYTYQVTDGKASDTIGFSITVNPAGPGPGDNRADVNKDGQVTVIDLAIVALFYGTRVPAGVDLPADVNDDKIVNILDLTVVANAIDAAGNAGAFTAADIQGVLEAIGEQVDVIEGVAEAPARVSTSQQTLLSGVAYQNVVTAFADAKQLATDDVRLGKWMPLFKELLLLLAEMQHIPDTTALLPNYPNPFNPETWIPYHLATDATVKVTIYDLRGSTVRTLKIGHQPAGIYESRGRAGYWDGRNNEGEHVASGLYFYTLTAGEFTATRKLLIAK